MLSPAAFQALKERVDLEFDPAHRAAAGDDGKPAANAEQFGIDDPVKLRLHIKNVPKLIVKVFELNPLNHFALNGLQIFLIFLLKRFDIVDFDTNLTFALFTGFFAHHQGLSLERFLKLINFFFFLS